MPTFLSRFYWLAEPFREGREKKGQGRHGRLPAPVANRPKKKREHVPSLWPMEEREIAHTTRLGKEKGGASVKELAKRRTLRALKKWSEGKKCRATGLKGERGGEWSTLA